MPESRRGVRFDFDERAITCCMSYANEHKLTAIARNMMAVHYYIGKMMGIILNILELSRDIDTVSDS